MATPYAITAGLASAVARPAKSRTYLGIFNQSANTITVAFDTAAVSGAAGQLTLATNAQVTFGPGDPQAVPCGAINLLASLAGSAVTIIE
jgi:hypothetical protein